MPAIVSQTYLADGFQIIAGPTVKDFVRITSADLPGTVQTGTLADAEIYVNNLIASKLGNRSFTSTVKVFQIVPLVVELTSTNNYG